MTNLAIDLPLLNVFLINFGDKLESQLMVIDVKQNEFRVVKIKKDTQCEFCNE